jgi:hypothetical protein
VYPSGVRAFLARALWLRLDDRCEPFYGRERWRKTCQDRKTATAQSLAIAMVVLAAFGSNVSAFPKSESFVVPAGQEKYVGDVPIAGEAYFKVQGKDVLGPARSHFRGLSMEGPSTQTATLADVV